MGRRFKYNLTFTDSRTLFMNYLKQSVNKFFKSPWEVVLMHLLLHPDAFSLPYN